MHWAGTAIIEADLELAVGNPAAAEAVLRESYEFMSSTAETGYLATIVDYATGANPGSVAAGDLNGDGKPDLAVANVNASRNSENRNFMEPLLSERGGCNQFAIAVNFTNSGSSLIDANT